MKVFALFIAVVHFAMAFVAILALNKGVSSVLIIINFTKALEPWLQHSFRNTHFRVIDEERWGA